MIRQSTSGTQAGVPVRDEGPAAVAFDAPRPEAADGQGGNALEVEHLSVEFRTRDGWLPVVDDVSFSLRRGSTLGLVGETGSGKTVTSLAVMGLIPDLNGRTPSGSVLLDGQDLMKLDRRGWQEVRGNRISMVFQQAIRSLNPAYTVGDQIAEVVRRHRDVSRREAWQRAVQMLDHVHIPNASKRAKEYPHTFSGGMCQRVAIAMALVCEPKVLIADEPTTALDVTVQAHILDLLRELQAETNLSILFITHDLGVVSEMCDRAAVMYAGQIVERTPLVELFHQPRHPYTAGLLRSVPKTGRGDRLESIRGTVPALDALPGGCRFHPRCDSFVPGRCDVEVPEIREVADGVTCRCLRAEELHLLGIVDQ
jgi:oligopeptide/dipeptide ABC transporter ATP-binding protein